MSTLFEPAVKPYGVYAVKVHGHLTPQWGDWFDGFSVTSHDDGTTSLVGFVADQPALHGIISRVRDLGLILLAVERRGDRPVAEG